VRKPPVNPPGKIPVRHMAVMAGMYRMQSGLKSLPEAEKEATELVQEYDAVTLAASSQALLQLLEARLEHKFQQIGGPGAVHFAGHGDFDPAIPDSSVMLLSDGKPLSSDFFRSANYGGDRQPLIFLNACMIGIGGELLGDMGGFPGNCLKGGFGGVLGALWEVNDAVAHDVALEFWRRALPPAGAKAEPVATILRDLRAKYSATAPVPTYLAYVYYGHPRLTLQRTN
jgi:CHAT domain-containing protein